MKNTKLVEFLRTFKARDFRRFGEFLHSPFFNKRSDIQQFYEVIRKWAPSFDQDDLTREAVWKAYSGEEEVNEKELIYMMNFVLKLAENYVATEAFQQDTTSRGIRNLEYCLVNGLNKHFKSSFDRTQKSLQDEQFRDAEWHLKAWRLADADMQHFYLSRTRKVDDSIQKVVENLDAFYQDKKLELGGELLNLNQILQTEYDTGFIDDLQQTLSKQPKTKTSVNIRKLVLNILANPEETGPFYELRALLPQVGQYFPPEKAKGIFAYAQNYCIRKIRTGALEFELELFRIYQDSIRGGYMYENGFISPWDFKNVCSVALKLKEFEWTERFIHSHERRLKPEFRAAAIAYNSANLAYHQSQYDQALKALMRVEFTDIFYALDTRRMMLMIYFERNDSESLFSLIASFKTYLRRNRIIAETTRAAYKNFVDWVARIYRSRPTKPARIAKMKSEIEAENQLTEREWLLKQLTS